MSELTDFSFYQKCSVTSSWCRSELNEYRPVEKFHKTTINTVPDNLYEADPTSVQYSQKTFESPIPKVYAPTVADSIPLQIWEGTVLEVDKEDDVMHVQLDAKMGQVPRHSADIELEWVAEQDFDLVKPGAVFYLTLFKRTKGGGSVENSQELRFRRRPSWSTIELTHIKENTNDLLSKMVSLPTAE